MKKLPLAERKRFVKEATAIITAHAVPYAGPHSTYQWQCMTTYGRFLLSPDTLYDIGSVPSVCGRFLENGDVCPSRPDRYPFNGKWNIHQFEVGAALRDLQENLASVQARHPTTEELNAWIDADGATEAAWAISRAEFRASLPTQTTTDP